MARSGAYGRAFTRALGFWLAGRLGGLWDSVPHSLFFAGMVVLALVGLAIWVALNRARVNAGAQA